jgi:PhnB protein
MLLQTIHRRYFSFIHSISTVLFNFESLPKYMDTSAISYPPLIPTFAVHDGAQAIAFYQQAFDATELYCLIDPESGKLGHAELLINGTMIMLADDEFHGHQSATIRDPFGHEWMLQKEIEKISPEEMQRRWDAMVKTSQATA